MLTYPQIKDLCKHAGEVLAICPINCKRCTADNCPAVDELFYSRRKCELEKLEKENEAERSRLERWSNSLETILNHYRELDAAYSENAELVKTTFADFAEALNKGASSVTEAKGKLKSDFDFINRYLEYCV